MGAVDSQQLSLSHAGFATLPEGAQQSHEYRLMLEGVICEEANVDAACITLLHLLKCSVYDCK